jgi:hypothetical protein
MSKVCLNHYDHLTVNTIFMPIKQTLTLTNGKINNVRIRFLGDARLPPYTILSF